MSAPVPAQVLERPLPHSADAERAILGSVLLDNSLVNRAIELLRPEDFYVRAHQFVFHAMIALSGRGSEIDPLLLSEELRREGVLEQAGGMTNISELTYGLPHFTKVAAYAKVVKDHSLMRQLVKVANKITSEALEGEEEAETVLAHARSLIDSTTQDYSLRASSCGAMLPVVRMADIAAEAVRWLWHPYIALGKFTLLEGDPGLGKSWLTCALAAAVTLGHGLPGAKPFEPGNVLMLSAEDGLGDTLRPRLDAVGADVSRVFAPREPFTLDAAGRQVKTVESRPAAGGLPASTFTYTAAYDGDGQVAYETSLDTAPTGGSKSSHTLHSVALGGEKLTTLTPSGSKETTCVPAGGLVFARQLEVNVTSPTVAFTERDPAGVTESNRGIYDPLGNYIPE